MARIFSVTFALAFLLVAVGVHAEDKPKETKAKKSSTTSVEFVSTGESDSHVQGNYDIPTADDPYAGKTVKERDFAGAPSTQKPYTDDCTDARCERAKKRQLSEGDTWKDDYKKGRRPNPYGTEGQ
jgi:hypothetical protein